MNTYLPKDQRPKHKFPPHLRRSNKQKKINSIVEDTNLKIIPCEGLSTSISKPQECKKFYSIVRSIIIWLRHYLYHSSQVKQYIKYFSEMGLILEKNYKDNNLLFAPENFQANKQARVNQQTLSYLKEDPDLRSPEAYHSIEVGLRGYKAIREYPQDVIKQIARYAWYQEFEIGSVIIREGDLPMYYYFIISGSAMVSIINKEKMIAETVANLGLGDSFGELSIIDNTRRKSSVIAKEKLGLLFLNSEDYIKIFMNGQLHFSKSQFLKSLNVLKDFPFDELMNHPKEILFSYFKPGLVLVEDSKLSEWVFIIKSGNCYVQTEIKKLELYENELKQRSTDSLNRQGIQSEDENLPHEVELRRAWRKHLRSLNIFNNHPIQFNTSEVGVKQLVYNLNEELNKIGRENTTLTLPSIKGGFLTTGYRNLQHVKNMENSSADENLIDEPQISYWNDQKTIQGQRTMATDLNTEFYKQAQRLIAIRLMHKDRFTKEMVTIYNMTSGMIFGLADYYFENQPNVRLISKGCECYCIRKSLFFELASEILLYNLGNTMRPFPSETEVLNKKIEYRYWNVKRKEILKSTLRNNEIRHVDVHNSRSFLPST